MRKSDIHVMPVSREADEVALRILGLAASGVGFSEISRREGRTDNYARVLVRRVMLDDLEFSGEPPQRVRDAYPRLRG